MKKIQFTNFFFDKDKIPFIIITTLVTFIIYLASLFRPWQPFDERLFYNETLFPIPQSLSEVFEVIKSFVPNSHLESVNAFFSNHLTLRYDPFTWTMLVILFFLFKKNVLLYHSFQLSIHLINTLLVWLILFKISSLGNDKIKNATFNLILISSITLIWALHSANTEAVLLLTNWNALLTYSLCFGFILYELNKITNKSFNKTNLELLSIAALFLLTNLITEYPYTLPIIIGILNFSFLLTQNNTITNSIKLSINSTKPYFMGLTLFIMFKLCFNQSTLTITDVNTITSPTYAFFERNLWLCPQIFIHFLKLLLFPKDLSTYQSNLVHLSNRLNDGYALFCLLIYICFLFLPIIFFVLNKERQNSFIFLLLYCLFFSMVPFLHILLPTYCLSADRYCYFPSFFLLLIIYLWIISLKTLQVNKKTRTTTLILILLILVTLSFRTCLRIREWNNPSTFYKAAIKLDSNPLYKAYKLIIYASYLKDLGKIEIYEKLLKQSLSLGSNTLELYKSELATNPSEPVTLQIYGLDYNSLLLKSLLVLGTIKNDHYKEKSNKTLLLIEPFLKEKLDFAGINLLTLYASILAQNNELEKAKEILEYSIKKYPYSLEAMLSLSNFYLNEKDLNNTQYILKKAYRYFPNDPRVLNNLILFYELKNDLLETARFSYLLGLRIHSVEAYQKALKIYLSLNKIKEAENTTHKLLSLDNSNPLSLLLYSRLLDLTGKREKILSILTQAYESYNKSYKLSYNKEQNVLKSILISLVNIHATLGNISTAKTYLKEFETLPALTNEDLAQLKRIKEVLK